MSSALPTFKVVAYSPRYGQKPITRIIEAECLNDAAAIVRTLDPGFYHYCAFDPANPRYTENISRARKYAMSHYGRPHPVANVFSDLITDHLGPKAIEDALIIGIRGACRLLGDIQTRPMAQPIQQTTPIDDRARNILMERYGVITPKMENAYRRGWNETIAGNAKKIGAYQ